MPAITEVACWSHCRRRIFDVWETTKSTVAKAALDQIAQFYAIEERPASPRPPNGWSMCATSSNAAPR